jgi:hypothetical protein
LLQKGIRIEHFVKQVQEAAETSLMYDCSIDALPKLVDEKQAELIALEQTIGSLESSKLQVLRENELTEKDINDYNRDKPLLETIIGLREEISDLKAEANLDKNRILVLESKWVVREIPENMTREEVLDAAWLLVYHAPDLIKAIKYIQKKAPLLAYTPTGPRLVDQQPK